MDSTDSQLPLHAAIDPLDGRRVVRFRGRPKKVRLQPRADERIYAGRMKEQRQAAVASDGLVAALNSGDTESVVATLKIELAREAACLAWEAQHAIEAGRDPSSFSGRRIDALTKLAAVTATALRLGIRRELDEALLCRLREFFILTVEKVAIEVAPQTSPALVEKLRERLQQEGHSDA